MTGYLIAEEGPLAGLVVSLEEGPEKRTSWSFGRDPDEAMILLEDPMVSRKHAIIRKTAEGFFLENLSTVNPVTQNGKIITDTVLLKEGDILHIGNTFFRFTERPDEEKNIQADTPEDLAAIQFAPSVEGTRWLLKVVAGPNVGAEFHMRPNSTYLLGKDPTLCDLVFQDLSVSRQHAKLTVNQDDEVTIEDLGSRNGVLVNGSLISDIHPLASQDVISLGTTNLLIIDTSLARETIVAQAPILSTAEEEEIQEPIIEVKKPPEDWRNLVIAKRHLVLAGVGGFCLLFALVAIFALFKTQPLTTQPHHETETVKKTLTPYAGVQFSFTEGAGNLFLVGHVITPIEKQELLYHINNLQFITNIEDNIVIDEYVWQNINALLSTQPAWQGVTVYSTIPGRFVLRGYLQTMEELAALSDYINMNFPYMDRLDNQVVVENTLSMQIQGVLMEKGFGGVSFQLSNGELVLSGMVDSNHSHSLNDVVSQFKALPGIRLVNNLVVVTTRDTSRVDLSANYQITGYSKKDAESFYVVINGRIFSVGDTLDGMEITQIQPSTVLLEKDGLKFKINYNLQ